MQHDASTASLMDHLGDIEKRRRAVAVRQKEMETKIALATQEEQALRRQCDAMSREEVQLKQQLDCLVREQQQLHVCLRTEAERVRHGETEEPLLLQHVTEQLAQIDAEAAEWQGRLQELERLHSAWESDGAAAAVRAAIVAATDAIAAATETKSQLESDLLRGEREARELADRLARAEAQSRGSDTAVTPAAALTDDAIAMAAAAGLCGDDNGGGQQESIAGQAQALRAELQRVEYETTHAAEQHARQSAALQREVDDLASRAAELTHWLTDVQASTAQFVATLQELRYCVAHHTCPSCRAADASQQDDTEALTTTC